MINTIGRRKTAVARLYLCTEEEKHSFEVNKREATQYFPHKVLLNSLYEPFEAIDQSPSYAIRVRVKGGGLHAQTEAIRLALSRALVQINNESKPSLRARGFLTRDARMVERKKYGRRKARRRFQFSKR